MTLPVALNPFSNPVAGMVPDVIAFNVRGQDNILVGALNQIITILGGGGSPLSVPAANVTAGTFGAASGGGFYGFSTPSATNDADFGALQIAAGTDGTLASLDLLTIMHPSATAGLRYVQHIIGDALGFRTYRIDASLTYIGATSGGGLRVTGTSQFDSAVNVVGDFSVATSKFTVDHTTGNTVVGAALSLVGASDTYEWLSTSSLQLNNVTTSATIAEFTAAGDLNILGIFNAIGGVNINSGKFTVNATTGNGVFAGTVTASNLSGTNTGDQTNISGNAATATLAAASTKLATARAINGVGFDGTAAITIAAAASSLTGTSINPSVTTSALTSVGTLVSLAVQTSITASGLPTTAGASGTLWVDTTGGLNIVKRA